MGILLYNIFIILYDLDKNALAARMKGIPKMINYSKILNPTAVNIKPSGIRKYFDITSQMKDVISLGIGEPDFLTPMCVRQSAIDALEQGNTKYTNNRGTIELRREIAKYVERMFGVSYTPDDEVLVTIGGSEAIDLAIRTVCNPGDEVIIPQPSYVCYEPITALAGAVPVIINTKAENSFKLTPEELRAAITDKTKVLILPYPSNPTGAIMERADIEAISEVLRDTDIVVVSDEVYSSYTFNDAGHVCVASVDGMRERTFTVNAFSKTFSMTGWRLGYLCAPRELMLPAIKIHQFAVMCAPTISQCAAITALTECDDEIVAMKAEYNRRRRIIVDGFNAIGLECREPLGAFYSFPCIKSTGLTSDEFCERLLREKHVAVIPGNAFGDSGEGFVRASYCYSTEHITEALRRIGEFVEELKAERNAK